MRRSRITKDDLTTCVCSAQTVFEGAVIGQVFIGDVRISCPFAEQGKSPTRAKKSFAVERRPIDTALQTVALWYLWMSVLGVDSLSKFEICYMTELVGAAIVLRCFSSTKIIPKCVSALGWFRS